MRCGSVDTQVIIKFANACSKHIDERDKLDLLSVAVISVPRKFVKEFCSILVTSFDAVTDIEKHFAMVNNLAPWLNLYFWDPQGSLVLARYASSIVSVNSNSSAIIKPSAGIP